MFAAAAEVVKVGQRLRPNIFERVDEPGLASVERAVGPIAIGKAPTDVSGSDFIAMCFERTALGRQSGAHLSQSGVAVGARQGRDDADLGFDRRRPPFYALPLWREVAVANAWATHRIALDTPTLKCAAA